MSDEKATTSHSFPIKKKFPLIPLPSPESLVSNSPHPLFVDADFYVCGDDARACTYSARKSLNIAPGNAEIFIEVGDRSLPFVFLVDDRWRVGVEVARRSAGGFGGLGAVAVLL